jgi:aminoglycoside 6-adenylyltransferase
VDQQAMVKRVTSWAAADENIRAVVLTGSFPGDSYDDLSDLDVELYLRDASHLLTRRDWYHEFGDVLAVEELDNPGWMPTRLLYLVDGKVDFAIGDLASFGVTPYSQPFRLVLDKDNRAEMLATSTRRQTPPSMEDFEQCVNWFSAAALMEARLIVRREPWVAKYRDWDLKGALLRMLVWDHKCRYGWDYETWYSGKHIDDWLDGDLRSELDSCWAGFACEDMAAALDTSLDLFRRVAERAADTLGFPSFHHDRVQHEVDRILATRPRS